MLTTFFFCYVPFAKKLYASVSGSVYSLRARPNSKSRSALGSVRSRAAGKLLCILPVRAESHRNLSYLQLKLGTRGGHQVIVRPEVRPSFQTFSLRIRAFLGVRWLAGCKLFLFAKNIINFNTTFKTMLEE